MWLAASCGNSESSQPVLSWSSKPVIKTASAFVFGLPGIVETGDRGYTSLAIDPDDNKPAIAYYDYGNGGRLKYAKYNGSTWDIAIVDDPTTFPDQDVGKYASLAFTSSGNPSIGYYDLTNGALKWAYNEDDDEDWDDNVNWPKTLADNETNDYGRYCSHDISGSSFGFAFYEATDGDLLYVVEYWESAMTTGVDSAGDVGQYCSLHFLNGEPTVSYYDETNDSLKYAKYNGSTFDSEVVHDPDDNVGKWTSLDYDYSGNPSIAYYNVTDTNPMWARWDSEEEEWVCVTLVDAGDEEWGVGMSHQWYSSTVCGFAFEAEENPGDISHLKFIRWVNGDQTVYAADNTYKCGDWCSMAWVKSGGASGDVWISHRRFDPENLDLRYAHGELVE